MPLRQDLANRLRIVVLGYIVHGPLGGIVWHHLQYVLGLARLGHDVYFLEDSDDYPSCYDPTTNGTGTDPAYGLEFAKSAFEGVGLAERWAFYDAHQDSWLGPAGPHAVELCRNADLLLNLSGITPLRAWMDSIPVRALVDTDPAFTQIRHLTDDTARARAKQHNAFFTFAENINRRPERSVPDDGFPWQPTRQPVVLDAWPVKPAPDNGKFTTVMQWDSYEACTWHGRSYGMKSRSFTPYLDLPSRVDLPLELAVGSASAPRDELTQHGWSLVDPRIPTKTPWTYQQYIQDSKAEFGVAKHGYVASRSGWFSERSTSYMASGRPVLVEDTGFTDWLEAGRGVLAFSELDEVLAGIDEINASYPQHCRWAREIVAEYFDANKVLPTLIDRALASCTG